MVAILLQLEQWKQEVFEDFFMTTAKRLSSGLVRIVSTENRGVYILILPGFGIISHIVSNFFGKTGLHLYPIYNLQVQSPFVHLQSVIYSRNRGSIHKLVLFITCSQKISREECEKEVNKVRRQERENAATELRNAISEVESKFQQELKKLSDANLQREQEQQRVISKLQEQEKKCSSLVESLSSNLADTTQQVVALYKRVQLLETQVLEEQQVSASRKRRAEELEDKIQRLTEELESAKAEREKKISNLEQVINATTKDLDYERKRFKGARQRIRLLAAQLRACYTTSEEMEHVLAKQQEELGAMQKALEEKELENASTQTNSNQTARNMETSTHNEIETMEHSSISSVETKANKEGVLQTSSDQNATELSHEGDMMQEG